MIRLVIPWLILAGMVVNAVAMIAAPLRWTAILRNVYGRRSNLPEMGNSASGRRRIRVLGCGFLLAALVMIRGLVEGMRQG
jgi:hypothetical protein